MGKSCFVIMGYGVKQGINLDLTYTEIIKPCITENGLCPVELFMKKSDNAFRCDEIVGSGLIDYKFVICLNKADIVIADISTMNNNAIYELGARHALKPRSTILMCAKKKMEEFKFFDLSFVPIIFYEHHKNKLSEKTISDTKRILNQTIQSCILSTALEPDNPIHRALNEHKMYGMCNSKEKNNIYGLYNKAKEKLDENDFDEACTLYEKLYEQNPDEETLLSLVLAKYKSAEMKKDCKVLLECIDLINKNVDIETSTSEYLFGRLAAINLRLFELLSDSSYYYNALHFYWRGSFLSKDNLYCPRNYCALLLRIYEVTDDINIIQEYYYTSKHFSRFFCHQSSKNLSNFDYEQKIYYIFNHGDLELISDGNYQKHQELIDSLEKYNSTSKRQIETIRSGVKKLHNDMMVIENKLNLIKIEK